MTTMKISPKRTSGLSARIIDREVRNMGTVYCKFLVLTEEKEEYINHLLHTEPSCEEECYGEDQTYTNTVVFNDGIEMDIKLCGVQYREGESNLPWTEAVLFKSGCEIGCSEPSDEYLGEWSIKSDDDTTYKVIVTKKA